jgi:Ca2+-binding EF-hand superfamily protein
LISWRALFVADNEGRLPRGEFPSYSLARRSRDEFTTFTLFVADNEGRLPRGEFPSYSLARRSRDEFTTFTLFVTDNEGRLPRGEFPSYSLARRSRDEFTTFTLFVTDNEGRLLRDELTSLAEVDVRSEPASISALETHFLARFIAKRLGATPRLDDDTWEGVRKAVHEFSETTGIPLEISGNVVRVEIMALISTKKNPSARCTRPSDASTATATWST